MKSNKQWFAVHVRAGAETKMADYLKKKGFETFCPLVKKEQLWLGKSKILLMPLFNTFLFVRISEKEQSLIKQCNGIIGFMYWLGKPVVIKDNEMYHLQLFVNEYPFLKLETTPISETELTKVISCPLKSNNDNLSGFKSYEVRLNLPTIGYQLVAEHEEKINIIEVEKGVHRAVI